MAKAGQLIYSLRQQITSQIRNDVLSGRLAEGEKLSENTLVSRFGVSRTPIRETLLQLTNEGLLEAKPNCGVTVARSAPDSVSELITPIRRTIEVFALRSFFDEIDEDDFRLWEEILERMKNACQRKDYPAVAEQDVAFHRSIVCRARESSLETIWSTIVAQLRRHFLQTQRDYSNLMDIYDEHVVVLEAFRAGKKRAAVKALSANIC